MSYTIIAAIAENFAIGRDNDLLWHISGDLKRFKKITTGHTIIMGRKTFQSLPKGPLPNRRNIVISRNPDFSHEGIEVVKSVEQAKNIAGNDREIFIIGGGTIYKEFLPIANKIYLTIVHKEYEADVFFPRLDYDDWDIEDKEENFEHSPPFTYVTLIRKNS